MFCGILLFEREATTERDLQKRILIARKLLETGESKEAVKLLKRAEEQARSINSFALLNEVYHTLIEYSYLDKRSDQLLLIGKLEKNTADLVQHERLNLVFAMVRRAFSEREHRLTPFDMESLIGELMDRYQVNSAQVYTFKSLFQIAQIADIYGASTKNYASVDVFFAQHLEALAGGPSDTEANLLYHIDLSYTLANIYFRKKDFSRCADSLRHMDLQLQRYKGKYESRRRLRHTTLCILHLLLWGKRDLAAQLIQMYASLKTEEVADRLKFQLAVAMVHFHTHSTDGVKKQLATFSKTDAWYERTAGLEWVLNKTYMEVLLYLELEEYDFVEARLHNFTRKYNQLLKTKGYTQVLEFVKIIRMICRKPGAIRTPEFREWVEQTITWKSPEEEDIFHICYYGWLKAKMEGGDVYETTLELMHRSSTID